MYYKYIFAVSTMKPTKCCIKRKERKWEYNGRVNSFKVHCTHV
jgi:hypothetical protein